MDLLDLLLEHDVWLVKRMLERAKTLSDEQLDATLSQQQPLFFEAVRSNLREMFHQHIGCKEMWVAAIRGRNFSEQTDKTIDSMVQRHEQASSDFLAIAHEIRDESKWQAVFVDAICVPPETFSFSSVVAHIITFSTHQRMVMLEALRRFGINDLGYGDPIEFERALVEG